MSSPEQQAELIEQYWAALLKDGNAASPADLLPERATTVRDVQRELAATSARASFRNALRQQLEAQASAQHVPANGPVAHPSLKPATTPPLNRWTLLART